MADMTTHEMLDDVNLTIEAAHVTKATRAIAGYVNGRYANWPAIVAKWGRSGMFLLSIDVQANPGAGAQCLDIELGDATIAQAPAWFKATQAAGKAARDLRWYPKLYTSVGDTKFLGDRLQALVDTMSAAGVKRDEYMLWSAHYTGKAHICGPSSCGSKVQADATQWTSTFEGASLDASLCYGYFFAGPPAPGAPALPAPRALVAYPSYRGVDLVWGAVEGAQEYDVQLLSGGAQTGRAKVTVNRATFPVQASTEYAFRVAALPGGSWSPEVSFKTPAAPPVPVDPPPPVNPPPVTPPPPPVLYVQRTVSAADAATVGVPAGTVLFIPYKAPGA